MSKSYLFCALIATIAESSAFAAANSRPINNQNVDIQFPTKSELIASVAHLEEFNIFNNHVKKSNTFEDNSDIIERLLSKAKSKNDAFDIVNQAVSAYSQHRKEVDLASSLTRINLAILGLDIRQFYDCLFQHHQDILDELHDEELSDIEETS